MAARNQAGVGSFADCVKAGGKVNVNSKGNGKYAYSCSLGGKKFDSGEKTSPLHSILARGFKKSGSPGTSEITAKTGTGV